MNQKELISQLKQLKEIKPRKEWVISLKSQILPKERAETQIFAQKVNFLDVLSSVFAPKKLAYSLAMVLFLIVGVFGFAQYTVPGDLLFPIKKIAEHSQAALTGQMGLEQNVKVLNNRINDLAQVAKDGRTNNIPSAISEISVNASQLVKNLKDNSIQNQQVIKEIAVSLKTLADLPGTDLTTNQDVNDLYQTIVQSQIADLESLTLTDEQNNALAEAKDLYGQGKYADALEKILLINN